jgi:exopolyphosphatase / guanosine-5'-triphosphate,3'-diphosphate pyrophosphatase
MRSKRVAVIDCGTNTFNLLIADISASGLKNVLHTKRVVKLGSEGIKDRIIGEKSQARALAALTNYKSITEKYKVQQVKIIGTAALRDALNGPELLRKIKKATGFKIQLIDGDQEATYIYKGVKASELLDESCQLIMDIGGGSTEFIICNQDKIFWKKSFRLGAARLLEELRPGDPIRKKEIQKMNSLLLEKLSPLLSACETYQPQKLIGTSGSFDSFAAVILKKKGEKSNHKPNYQFNLTDYKKVHSELLKSTYKERLKIPGLVRMRADMIVLATLLLTFVLQSTKIKSLYLSKYALKEGVLHD